MDDHGNQPGGGTVIQIEIGPRTVAIALSAARDFAKAHDLGPETRGRLAVIVEELVFNLVDHSGMAPGDCIEVGMTLEPESVLIALGDCGMPFDPRGAGSPDDLPDDHIGGVGVAMVLAWADVVDYAREGDRNRLTLRMRFFD